MCACVPDQIGIWQCWFFWRGEKRRTWRNTSRSKERAHNNPNPHVIPAPRIEPRPTWWEASALTTAPPLLPLCMSLRRRDGTVVRALASLQCGPGSISRLGITCGLSLLVLYSAPRGFSLFLGTVLWFSPPSKTNLRFNASWFDLFFISVKCLQ